MADRSVLRWYLPLHHRPPLRVDFVAPADLPAPGRLGLTIAPGTTHEPGEPVDHHLVERDVARLVSAYGARALVTLQEADELDELPGGDPLEEAARQGLETIWLPIPDGSAPATVRSAVPVVERVVALLQAGQTVVVHCLGGLGRSGLLAACVLVRMGAAPAEAMARVRAARPGAIQMAVQERFVARFAARLGAAEAAGREEA